MIAVIQCASGKRADAGHLKTRTGTPVTFVAKPTAALADKRMIYAHPDDESDHGGTWRNRLLEYNKNPGNNRLAPDAPGCELRRFQTSTRTNWHYECVRAFIEGKLDEP